MTHRGPCGAGNRRPEASSRLGLLLPTPAMGAARSARPLVRVLRSHPSLVLPQSSHQRRLALQFVGVVRRLRAPLRRRACSRAVAAATRRVPGGRPTQRHAPAERVAPAGAVDIRCVTVARDRVHPDRDGLGAHRRPRSGAAGAGRIGIDRIIEHPRRRSDLVFARPERSRSRSTAPPS